MTCHPCADHYASCDHCALCEGLGICCATVPVTLPRVADDTSQKDYAEILRQAIVDAVSEQPSLVALITTGGRPAASVQSSLPAVAASVDGPGSCVPRALPAASTSIDIVSLSEPAKEPVRVKP